MDVMVLTLSFKFLLGLITIKLQKVLLLHVCFNSIRQCAFTLSLTGFFFLFFWGGGVVVGAVIVDVHLPLFLMDYYEKALVFA